MTPAGGLSPNLSRFDVAGRYTRLLYDTTFFDTGDIRFFPNLEPDV